MSEIQHLYKSWDKDSKKPNAVAHVKVATIKVDGSSIEITQNIIRSAKGSMSIHTFAETNSTYAHLHPGEIFLMGNC